MTLSAFLCVYLQCMNIESAREYCLSLPMATEDMPFGPECLVLRVGGRIFACIGLEWPDYFVMKCDPDLAIDLRDRYPEIAPAWHWNKRHWNQVSLAGTLSDDFIAGLIRHSYSLVVAKLPKVFRSDHPEILTVRR